MDFLADNNICGQTLLKLVSRGNAIIAEILRLAEFVPPVFKADVKDQGKHSSIIFDFSYFNNEELYKNRIDNSMELQDLDDEFRENNLEILTRFYLAFEGIHKYVTDLNRYLEELDEGVYIQQTLETVLLNGDGKQLMAEALYLYGVMLLVVDSKIDGFVRERMLVSYHRYGAQQAESNIDDVCKLLRSTGFSKVPGVKQTDLYPAAYFKRVPISATFIDMLIGRLRSDDIYNQIAAYPLPAHRSAALATQASMLYIILFFAPELLQTQHAKMREIVDKHFPDNWVINVYMGMTVNLVDAWAQFKAASVALNNTVDPNNVKEQANMHARIMTEVRPKLQKTLKEGVLQEEYILDNVNRLMKLITETNVTLRWLMLHCVPVSPVTEANKRCKMLRDMVVAEAKHGSIQIDALKLLSCLLDTAQLELKLREMFRKMLDEKQKKWESYKIECTERMLELADVFSGTKPLTRVDKNESLQKWFSGQMAEQIRGLDYEDSTSAGRKIVQIVQALSQVQQYHQLESNLQVIQFLKDTEGYLGNMIRVINIKEDFLSNLQIVSDVSYAWNIIDASFTSIMQQGIKSNARSVIKLRAVFLKLASALDLPLMRISQAKSRDLVSVSQYYSGELVNYVRKVLQIIPETMFEQLASIIKLQTMSIKEVPTRLDKDKMKEYAQLDDRYKVAELTYSISVFTDGMLAMKKTLVGIISVDPKQLLEDGIRKELVKRVATALHGHLKFNNPKAKTSELMPKLQALGATMDGFRRSFEYIQDYVAVSGLQILQQELSRIVSYNVEQECNSFLRTKVLDFQSIYQSTAIPIPRFAPVDESVNFIGRLAREILKITDPRYTVYVEPMGAWYDYKTKAEIVNRKLAQQLLQSIDVQGLTGLDRLYSFMIVQDLQTFARFIDKVTTKERVFLEMKAVADRTLRPLDRLASQSQKTYVSFIQGGVKIWQPFLTSILKVGQMQILRKMIAHQLSTTSKFESKFLASALSNMNQAMLNDIERHYHSPEERPYPAGDNPLMYDLTSYLEASGICNPLDKIYITTKNVAALPLAMFMMVISHLPKLTYNKAVGTTMSRRIQDAIDGPPFIIGCLTVLKQFNSQLTTEFIQLLSQYVKSTTLDARSNLKATELPSEALYSMLFLDEFTRHAKISKKVVESYIPPFIFDEYKEFLSKSA